MNLTARKAKKFTNQVSPSSSGYFLSFPGEVLAACSVLGFFIQRFLPHHKDRTCAEKRLISARPAEVIRTQNRYSLRDLDLRFRPRSGFHFWPENSHLTNSTFPESLWFYSGFKIVFNYRSFGWVLIQLRLNYEVKP